MSRPWPIIVGQLFPILWHKSDLVPLSDNTRPNVNVQDRKDSPIIGLKNFNNWIKSVLIGKYSRIPDRTGPKTRLKVLDIGCGKGGDLNKWDKAGTEEYIGIGQLLLLPLF